ncbi:hypothetical protein HQ529_01660 [Candidatus Woesearchaeota archaeon]|nr:hypothetical protein [Candidatus Woesearchaeota archaeon]
MKIKLSISVNEDILDDVKKNIDSGMFRSTSHAVEFAVKKFLEGVE